jgi:hypothetical protein
MADIFISHTGSDRDWAFWLGKELQALGHTAHVHEWEVWGGDDIYAWMEQRHDTADHVPTGCRTRNVGDRCRQKDTYFGTSSSARRCH